MKRALHIFLIIITFASIAGCSGSSWGAYRGQLLGVFDRPKWRNVSPYGMVYVKSGTLHIGGGDQDVNHTLVQRPKSISIQGFYMDDTEITNNEYRQFVYWVRDSIAAKTLGGEYLMDNEDGSQTVDWEYPIYYDDPEVKEQLSSMFFSKGDGYWGKQEWDVSQFIYQYRWFDFQLAAKEVNNYRKTNMEDDKHWYSEGRAKYWIEEETMIYPDTLVWVRDFTYSYNEPMTRNYFWHPAFDYYPVVGLEWAQTNAFSMWRSRFWNEFRISVGEIPYESFRIPTEHEGEYAARGGLSHQPYPWGGPYVRNAKGCILANFKPGRGNYPDDGGFYTVRADAYNPNDYGLYNMAGNVAEWTSSAFYENSYSFQDDLNPDVRYDAEWGEPETAKRKVIRGGSWKDIAYYIQTGTRHWEYQDSAKSYVGFRNVITFLGRSKSDFE